jgi:3',5'-cyclic AMP phosphodiesterase CpdA
LSRIVQLSDLHLLADPREQALISDALVAALADDHARRGGSAALLAITGDVFDSATLEPKSATRVFLELHERIQGAIGGEVPTIIVPGNHDRRRAGLFAPHREELFQVLAHAAPPSVWVHGCDSPFLSRVIPASFHGLPLWVVAFDSSFLPNGLLSAGGMIRQEDLLQAASQLRTNPDWPVLFLLHHHLVPTPLTDLGAIDLDEQRPLLRWGVQRLLPRIVAHADREELTMTALGAGTALSTLHTLGRAVLVLHGHKHYATARMLDGVAHGEGDVLIVSAGSAGTAQTWNATTKDAARIWPSFNVAVFEDGRLEVDMVSFSWKERSGARPVVRPLAVARKRGARWDLDPVDVKDERDEGPELELNQSEVTLRPSRSSARRFDADCVRTILGTGTSAPGEYLETVHGIANARLLLHSDGAHPRLCSVPRDLRLVVGGATRYRLIGGLCRTLTEVERAHGDSGSPFEWVGLMNRYRSASARLTLAGLGEGAADAFASVTDLGTGRERPWPIERSEDQVLTVEHPRCRARTLIRIYWPLQRATTSMTLRSPARLAGPTNR